MADALGTQNRPLNVAVVGSGPSGFYAAAALYKADGLEVRVDLFDRLPTPFGLVRGGVAPDHPKIKAVSAHYEKTAADPRSRFFGNVTLGRDLLVSDLEGIYDCIVYAMGCESDRKLGIPGEDLHGVYSSTEFVGWFNGHPDFASRSFDLDHATRVAIFGNGNVAADVARILAHPPEDLAGTDIAGYALSALRSSRVREILVIGRRGPAQSAFSTKEIHELSNVRDTDLVLAREEVEVDPVTEKWFAEGAPATAQRNLKELTEVAERGDGGHSRKIVFRFLSSPVEFLGDKGRLTRVRLEAADLYTDKAGVPRPTGNGKFTEEPIQLAFAAIGYRGRPVPGVPFDSGWGTIPNVEGRVTTARDGRQIVPNQYVVGWAKRGPSGLIGTNLADSKATVQKLLEDMRGAPAAPLPDRHEERVVQLLRNRGVRFVTLEDWYRLDRHEREQGDKLGKIREKITCIDEMLNVISSSPCSTGSGEGDRA
ncbi:MAG: NAD(P)-binding protein [Planctomycetota bacterium]